MVPVEYYSRPLPMHGFLSTDESLPPLRWISPPGADGDDVGEAPLISPRSDSSSVLSSVAASPFSSGRYDSDRPFMSEIEEIPSGRWLSPPSPCRPLAPDRPEEALVGGGATVIRGKAIRSATCPFQPPEMGTPTTHKGVGTDRKPKSPVPVIPDYYLCPISLELMKDPVIVSTGQAYERSCIEKWLEAGHNTCPKTQQPLSNMSLTPDYVLRGLIAQWCEANGIDPPKRQVNARPSKPSTSGERPKIDVLLRKLSSHNPDDQRSAAAELRLLSKRNADNRVCIAEAGAIPLLVNLLLPALDPRTQEHAVTALLNLSVCEENKGAIICSGAVPGIVHVLKKGSMEARENAAATLFSLSVVDENKVTIGASGAIPALVALLSEGSQRGKKDAATALFNLCIYQGNKGKAVRAGVVPTLMALLTEPAGGMVDEALAILAILASHPEGKAAIGAAEAVPVLVDVIGSGSPRNRENAAAVLVHLCSGEQQHQHLAEAQERGIMGPLQELAQNGTERGKRKALQLLDRMNRFVEQQKLVQAQAESVAHAGIQEGSSQGEESQLPTPSYPVDK